MVDGHSDAFSLWCPEVVDATDKQCTSSPFKACVNFEVTFSSKASTNEPTSTLLLPQGHSSKVKSKVTTEEVSYYDIVVFITVPHTTFATDQDSLAQEATGGRELHNITTYSTITNL